MSNKTPTNPLCCTHAADTVNHCRVVLEFLSLVEVPAGLAPDEHHAFGKNLIMTMVTQALDYALQQMAVDERVRKKAVA